MQDILEKLKWYKSNLTSDNSRDFDRFIGELLQHLPENYRIKLEPLVFYELVNDEPLNDLPF
jgi:hypothetical protein